MDSDSGREDARGPGSPSRLEAGRSDANRMRAELDDLIADGARSRALRRLLDYANDYARPRKNDAVILSSRWNVLLDERRRFGASPDLERRENEVTHAVLELADRILNDQPPQPATSTSPDDLGIATPGNQSPDGLTRFERAREGFKKKLAILMPAQEVPPSDVAVRCRGLAARYGGKSGKLVFEGADLDLRYGEVTAIVGINGAGKSTLLRIIGGELAPSAGRVDYYGIGGATNDWGRIRQKIGYVRQEPPAWYGRIIDNLELSAARAGFLGRANTETVEFFLQRLGIDAYRNMKWIELSGGFKMRCELALALVTNPDCLVLDEPLAPLDIIAQQRFLQDLRDLANSKKNPLPIVVTSQHLYEVEAVADQMVVIERGKVRAYRREELGADREGNLYEVVCALDRGAMEAALQGLPNIGLSRFGSKWIVETPLSVTGTALLSSLLSSGVSPELFHDVSRSTRRFFGRALEDE